MYTPKDNICYAVLWFLSVFVLFLIIFKFASLLMITENLGAQNLLLLFSCVFSSSFLLWRTVVQATACNLFCLATEKNSYWQCLHSVDAPSGSIVNLISLSWSGLIFSVKENIFFSKKGVGEGNMVRVIERENRLYTLHRYNLRWEDEVRFQTQLLDMWHIGYMYELLRDF